MNALSRSWQITKLTFGVINKDKELLWFALLAFIFSTIYSVVMIVPSILPMFTSAEAGTEGMEIYQYVIIFFTYLGLAFIATFFNTCVVYTAKVRFEGGDATFSESLKFALSRLGLIFQWSLISATIGLILKILDNMAERFGQVGQIIASILIGIFGMAWSVITIFVVPVMVYEGVGPIDAIKKSTSVIKKTWGESLIKTIGLGIIQFFTTMLVVILSGVLLYYSSLHFGGLGFFVSLMVGLLLILLVFLVFGVASTIFNTVLYLYANTGKAASGFDNNVIRDSFQTK
jgi:hypothetical protein